MSIKPIDLQTLFLKMSEVGKEQAQAKDAVEAHQSIAAKELTSTGLQKDHSVNRTEETGEEQKVEEEPHENAASQEEKKRRDKRARSSSAEEERAIVGDPDVGKRVDISG